MCRNGIQIKKLRHPWRKIWIDVLLVSDGERTVLIDSGVPETAESVILPALKGLPPLSLIINTHSHSDHAGGNPVLQAAYPDCRISVPGTDTEIREGGLTFRIVHTPGHSPDSVCVIEQNSGTLFAGDAVQGKGVPAIGLPLWADMDAYCNSIQKLRRMFREGKFRRMICAHGFVLPDGTADGDQIEPFLLTSLETAERLMETAAQAASAEELYQQLLAVPPCPEWEWLAKDMITRLYNKR